MIDGNYVRLGSSCHCGEPIRILTGRGRPPKSCEAHKPIDKEPPKKIERSKAECPACRGFFTPGKDQKYCSKTCAGMVRRKPLCVCVWCQKEFKATKSSLGLYCSYACRGQHVSDKCNRAKAANGLQVKATKPLAMKFCSVCGVQSQRSRCSRTCELAYGRNRGVDVAMMLHRQDAKVIKCVECDADYCPLYGYSHAALCTPCASSRQRASKSARRAIRKAAVRCVQVEPVDPHKVFDRDGWCCKICGVETPKAMRGSYEDNAPELDHIRPISKRGEHSYRNTQCACRKCNAVKSNEWESGGFEIGQA